MKTRTTTRESSILRAVKKYLKDQKDCCFFKIHGSLYSERGIPDLVGSVRGLAVFIELKTKTGVLTTQQSIALDRLSKVGAIAVVCRSLDDVRAIVERVRRIAPDPKARIEPKPSAEIFDPSMRWLHVKRDDGFTFWTRATDHRAQKGERVIETHVGELPPSKEAEKS